jgi:hypothetical protein
MDERQRCWPLGRKAGRVAYILIPFALIGCERKENVGASAVASTGQHETAVATSGQVPQSSVNPLDQKALDKARELFAQHWTQCGDTWISDETGISLDFQMTYTKASRQLVELKGVRFTVPWHANQATDADKLNGIEWKGAIDFKYAAGRRFPLFEPPNGELHGPWSDWWAPESTITRSIHLVKKSGAWLRDESVHQMFSADPLGDGTECTFASVPCDSIAKLTAQASTAATSGDGGH